MEVRRAQLSDKDKLLKLFELKHGKITGSCSAQVCYNPDNPDDDNDLVVACMKDGEICWYDTREDLLFYLFYYCTQNL